MKFLITVFIIFLIGIISLFVYFNMPIQLQKLIPTRHCESCPPGQIALYEGGQLTGCETKTIPSSPSSSPATPNVNPEPIKSSQPITSSPTPQSKPYQNPCPSGQFELFEGGLSSGCEPR